MSYFSKFKTNTDPIVFRCTIIDTLTNEVVGDFLDYSGRMYPIMSEETLDEFQQATGLGKRVPIGCLCPAVRNNEGLEPGEILVSDAWVQDDCRIDPRFKKIDKRTITMSDSTVRVALKRWAKGLDPYKLHDKTYIDIEKYLCHIAMEKILSGTTEDIAGKVQKERELWMKLLSEANPTD